MSLREQIEQLQRIVPADLEADEAFYRNGEYVRLADVLALLDAETPDPKLLAIAGLVNTYHNDGTRLTAAETLRAIADVLGKPMVPGTAPAQEPEQ